MVVAMKRRRKHRRPFRDDSGFVGGLEGMIFGSLIFVAGTLLVANAWGVVATKFATETAARDAARAYVEGSNASTAWASAETIADGALAGYGRSPGKARIQLMSGSLVRCARVTIEVTYPAPVVDLPFVGRVGHAEVVTARSSQLVDPYRSGLPGTSTCG